MKVLRQPKGTPEVGLKPEKGFFLQHKRFFFTTMRSKQAAAPKQARPAAPSCRPAVWPPCGREAQEVVKKNLFCCKKKPFRRSSDSLNALRRQVRSLKKVFFYTEFAVILRCCSAGHSFPARVSMPPIWCHKSSKSGRVFVFWTREPAEASGFW